MVFPRNTREYKGRSPVITVFSEMLPVNCKSRKKEPPVACGVDMGVKEVENLPDGIFAGGVGTPGRRGIVHSPFFFLFFLFPFAFFRVTSEDVACVHEHVPQGGGFQGLLVVVSKVFNASVNPPTSVSAKICIT